MKRWWAPIMLTVSGVVLYAPVLLTLFLPTPITIQQPTPVLTFPVIAGGPIQIERSVCVHWPRPLTFHGEVVLIAVDRSWITVLAPLDAVLPSQPPCRTNRFVYRLPADTPPRQYYLQWNITITEPLGAWASWRQETIVLTSDLFSVVPGP